MNIFNFENTYQTLPDNFYSNVKPEKFERSELLLLNSRLLSALNIDCQSPDELVRFLSGQTGYHHCTPFAQAYAGHQFGHFTMLGDGRAVVLGEHLTNDNQRFDIQLKGSGQTPYSRRGDGKATLRAMLREYLISEAMHHLNIDSSGSLAVLKTNEPVYRETVNEGAVLARVMKSHIRIGTFEYASYLGKEGDLEALLQYTINRLYPELQDADNQALALIEKLMHVQINLIVNWMRVGFIHGVMNTDNVAISGETFDYGPCAFLNAYHPQTVFSSIDVNGRYAFGNQPDIQKWNLVAFAQALLPLIHKDEKKAVTLAQDLINQFDELWSDRYYAMMLGKIGIEHEQTSDRILIDELLEIMRENQLDYTNTFSSFSSDTNLKFIQSDNSSLQQWLEKWKVRIGDDADAFQNASDVMRKNNPVFIPRNHLVEEALTLACNGDCDEFNVLLNVLKTPYQQQQEFARFLNPPEKVFETKYKTYCGT